DFGPLPNTNFTNTPGGTPGEAISDLTFNPTLVNPFLLTDSNPGNDNKKGVLLGVDTGTDQLVVIDLRSHFPFPSFFSVTVGGGDSSAVVSMAMVDPLTANEPRRMPPFDGNVTINTLNAQNGTRNTFTATAGGSGSVLVGLKTLNTIQTTQDEEQIPI